MNGTPLVSVLMTAFNRERYIAEAIESVLAQTFTDFELIVVDDASEDRTLDIVGKYETDPRVRVVVNKRNLGDYSNRNRAATLARGRFLKYHDSDDVMYPHCLATMVGLLAVEPRAGAALSGSAAWVGGPCPMLLSPRMCYQREFLGSQGLFMCGPSSALFRTDAFRGLGGFPEVGVGSDLVFWLKACAQIAVVLVPADLFWYRVHPGQEQQKERAALEYAQVSGGPWLALTSPDCPLTAEEREQAKCNWAYVAARGIYRELRAGRWGIARAQLTHLGLTWRDWLRYLRRPHRDPLAGTPLDDFGENMTSHWPSTGRSSSATGDRR